MAGRRKGLSFNRKRRKRLNYDVVMNIVSWVIPILIEILIAGVLVNLFAIRSNMVGPAMEGTVNNQDQILINKFSYILQEPKAGDVIVFLPNGNERSHYYVRRVVAVPGDEVLIRNGCLYVNGEEKSYGNGDYITDAGICEETLTLGNDEYFVLGDNTGSSEDSRYANIGNVKKKYIIGKAWFRFASIRDIGFVK